MTAITILDETRLTSVDAAVDGDAVWVDATEFEAATGWRLKPEGLCRGDVCVPVRARPDVAAADRIDARAVAPLLGRVAIVDVAAGVLAYGAAPNVVADDLAERRAPDFTLPQLGGTPFTFSAIGRKKKVLVTWASW